MEDHQFNVYTADGRWTFIENFWNPSKCGLVNDGDYRLLRKNEEENRYGRSVYIKRMD